ncbi:MAG TPA: SMI1/KNR4 family protein [Gemmataceae bacterium]|nr:SMI1/KNR4 family protein [Gemmataceae bacterium]
MTDADLDRIEAALDLKLPAFYRRYMLSYPRWLPEKQPEWSDVAENEFADNPDRVIYFNQYVRDCKQGEFIDDMPWPRHYFVIGSEGEQNWYFLDLASGSEAVYLFQHDCGEVSQYARSLGEFPAALVRWWEDVERDG